MILIVTVIGENVPSERSPRKRWTTAHHSAQLHLHTGKVVQSFDTPVVLSVL